jgi:hypothetical protein
MTAGQAVIVLLLELMCPTWERISAEDWRVYTSSEFGLYQYDTRSLRYPSDNIVRVRQKLVLNNRGTANLVQAMGSEYQRTKEIIIIREIDCAAKRTHILGLIYVAEGGGVIERESYEPVEWDTIAPDSVDVFLYLAVCEGNEVTHD